MKEPRTEGVEQLLLRAEEVARALGVGRTTVYALMKSGELPVTKVGRLSRISLVDLRAWVEKQRRGA